MKYMIAFLATMILACTSKAQIEYVLDEKDLVPEGIAYSSKTDAFYLTSVTKSKIVAVDRSTGKQTNFIEELEFGYQPGVGIWVDDQRNELHALGGYYMLPDSLSSLYTFDINTHKLLKRYDLSDKHFLNDMVVDINGNIYLTDTKDASVYLLKRGSESLELFYKSPEIDDPNGIAISEDNTKLYVASWLKGVRVLEISTKKILNDTDTIGVSQGLDGLEFHKGHLYAIQNGSDDNGFNFRKLLLNEKQENIVDVEVIDNDQTRLDVPLTFCFAENKAVVIGNSNIGHLNQETMQFSESDTIKHTKLLVYEIE
ncbi:MAG: SMP-30/gluconolactonase/LRE family protein [Maribacter sp.]